MKRSRRKKKLTKPEHHPNRLFAENSKWAERRAQGFIHNHDVPAYRHAEITQAALLGLWTACRTYKPKKNSNFRAFARPRINGEIWDVFRSRRDRRIDTKYDGKINMVLTEEELAGDADDQLESAVTREEVERVKRLRLGGNERRVYKMLKMYHVDGYSQGEIAERTGLSLRAIWRLLRCALVVLREKEVRIRNEINTPSMRKDLTK